VHAAAKTMTSDETPRIRGDANPFLEEPAKRALSHEIDLHLPVASRSARRGVRRTKPHADQR